ncbi:stage II sporulation protein M [Amycolatopsis cihanbeyliensis]|uniref:Putative membrane protein SpoIIM required for sporulation n=1 Tax=Amycolatopsis cihanbeyliensis TaxID=1128664 RepID=A0A542DP97_AMYCI|nr:stage II sporulation protein M [Amycolatopsis cihanbeyliensis]TQJ04928.1 putative membrane protein SpoIIM required for sporulation [Amycolatopsis cihanbeyliensis]
MDVDVFVAEHGAEWDRLAELVRRAGRLRGEEADELVLLYQRAATHLSIVRSAAPDPALLARLSTLVARARSAVTGTHNPAWREVGLFFSRRFPAAVYRGRRWWLATTAAFALVSALLAVWISGDPRVRSSIAAPEEVRRLTAPGGDFESYYSSGPATAFAAQVWTNNAWVAAGCLLLGVLLCVPVLVILWFNALNLGVSAGLMAEAGRLDVFFGLITPHGLLELTAVFVAAGAGMRLGWTVIDPGRRGRAAALAQEGRSVVAIALGLTCVLLISGVIEAFVTPSGLPGWARIGIGVTAEAAFLAYVFVLGRRAALAGETGDLDPRFAGDTAPATA